MSFFRRPYTLLRISLLSFVLQFTIFLCKYKPLRYVKCSYYKTRNCKRNQTVVHNTLLCVTTYLIWNQCCSADSRVLSAPDRTDSWMKVAVRSMLNAAISRGPALLTFRQPLLPFPKRFLFATGCRCDAQSVVDMKKLVGPLVSVHRLVEFVSVRFVTVTLDWSEIMGGYNTSLTVLRDRRTQ